MPTLRQCFLILFLLPFSVNQSPFIDDELDYFALPDGGSVRASYHVDLDGYWLMLLELAPDGETQTRFFPLPVNARPDRWRMEVCNSYATIHLHWPVEDWYYFSALLQWDSEICEARFGGGYELFLPSVPKSFTPTPSGE